MTYIRHDWDSLDPKLRELGAQGLSASRIAAALGLAEGTVLDRLARWGLRERIPRDRPQPAQPPADERVVPTLQECLAASCVLRELDAAVDAGGPVERSDARQGG